MVVVAAGAAEDVAVGAGEVEEAEDEEGMSPLLAKQTTASSTAASPAATSQPKTKLFSEKRLRWKSRRTA